MVFYIHPSRKNWSFMTASSSLEYFEQQFRYQHINNSPRLRVIHLYYIAKKKKMGFPCPVNSIIPNKNFQFFLFFLSKSGLKQEKKSKNKLKNFKNSFQKLVIIYLIIKVANFMESGLCAGVWKHLQENQPLNHAIDCLVNSTL